MPTNPKPGARVKYTHPNLPFAKEMTGFLEVDSWEKITVFMPDRQFHSRLERAGYEPAAGLMLEGADLQIVH